jgi:ribosome-binding factor A
MLREETTMPGEVKRAIRVGERLRQELSTLIATEARDPRVSGVVVARIHMPDDLRNARVFIRLLEGGDDVKRRAEALEGLARAAGMLRREVTKRMKLRFAPALQFVYDEGQDKVTRIEELLAEVKADERAREPDGER